MFDSVRVATRTKVDALVIGLFKDTPLDKQTLAHDKDGSIKAAAKRTEGSGALGSIAEAFPTGRGTPDRVIIIGLGDKKDFGSVALRAAAAAAARRLAKTKCTSVKVDLAAPIKAAKLDNLTAGQAFGEGVGLVAWSCDEFRGSGTPDPKNTKLAIVVTGSFGNGVKRGLGLAESTNIARSLSQTPPNIATPMFMAAQARKIARQTGMKCSVIKGKQLEAEKMEGLINVGKASENEPCLIRLEYKPSARGKAAKPAVLVGKTITYDTGGLSIKPPTGMKGMKRDKDGGCNVLGAMHAIATVIKPNRPVVALLVAAENSISDNAYRPDDVLTFRNGVTVEVTNTDAEGRLVLADGLCWACDKEDPAYIVDMATLTGGVVVALGSTYAGLWCDDDKLRAKVDAAADATGERVWRLPHHTEYREMMRSPVADIVNSAPVREAHPIQGAAFLANFIDEGVPWAHIDIAGVHATDKEKGPFCPGPVGFGVRLIAELVDRA